MKQTENPKSEGKPAGEPEIIHDPVMRICPNCRRNFKLNHLSRKFCSNECKDGFHARIKRDNRLKERAIEEAIIDTHLVVEEKDNHKALLQRNLEIIASLNPDKAGKLYHVIDLQREGFDFFTYEGRFPFDKSSKDHFISMGAYNIALIHADRVLIKPR